MELALNLFWFALTLASFVLWGRRRSSTPGVRRRLPMLGAIALGSALVILFPVISVSDDLHSEQAVLEDSNPSKRTLRQAHGSFSNPGKLRHTVPAVAGAWLAPLALIVLGRISLTPARSAALRRVDARSTRAPPLYSI